MKKLLVGIFAVAMVFAFTAPTMASDWNFYGSARMATFSDWTDSSASGDDDQRTTTWGLQGNARIGAKVKTNDNGIGGGFEYGSGPNLRKLYGTWNFGGGEILIGQTYTPTTHFISNQVWAGDNDLIGYGMPYCGRQPMIRLKVGGFQFAAITPKTPLLPGYAVTSADGITGSIETTLPKLETAYNFKTDMFFIRPYLGYNTYVVEQSDGRDRTLSSWLGGLTFGVTPGAFYFKGGAFYALNPSAYGISMDTDVNTSYEPRTSEITDVDAFGFQALAGFKVNDGLTFEAGLGMTAYSVDEGQDLEDAFDDPDATDWSAYVNASVTLAPGFFIVPEFGWVTNELDGSDSDVDNYYFGAKWQINF